MKSLYLRNIKYLYVMAALKGSTFAAALLVPFLNEKGLDQAEIMILQSFFSLAVILLEVPTGYVADRFSRVLSIRLGTLAVGLGFLSYSFLESFAVLFIVEFILAVGFALLSGADEALFYDSLKAAGEEKTFKRRIARVHSIGFGAVAVVAPIGGYIAGQISIPFVVLLDAMLILMSFVLTFRLKEPPRVQEDLTGKHPLRDMKQVIRLTLRGHSELTRLLLLGAALSASTYFGFWLAPVYFESVGISVVWFGAILSFRSAYKAIIAHFQSPISSRFSDEGQLLFYALLSVSIYIGLALLSQPVAIVLLLGFDTVQALQGPVISYQIHSITESSVRAQVMSVLSLLQRATYGLLGPIIGFSVDRSVSGGLLLAALIFSVAFFVLFRIKSGK